MTQTNTARALEPRWQPLCSLADLVPQSGVVALHEGEQVALFYLPETAQKVFAVGNRVPKSGANVIGRGIVGQLGADLGDRLAAVQAALRLADGGCLEYPEQALPTWTVRLNGERVEIA